VRLSAVWGVLDSTTVLILVRELSLLLLPRALVVCTTTGNINRRCRRVAVHFQPVAASHLSTSRDVPSGFYPARKEGYVMNTTVNNTAVTPNPDPSNPRAEAGVNLTAEPGARLNAEGVIAELRTMRSQIDEPAPLPKEQRKLVKRRLRSLTKPVVDASINVMGVLDILSEAIGQPLEEVRQLQDDSVRWEAVADEVRAFLKTIESSNLVRHRRLAFVAMQAYSLGSQLAKDPAKAVLVPHVEEVKRLKAISRRKKPTQTAPAPAPVPDPSTTPKA